jgi:hypothetical protein
VLKDHALEIHNFLPTGLPVSFAFDESHIKMPKPDFSIIIGESVIEDLKESSTDFKIHERSGKSWTVRSKNAKEKHVSNIFSDS